MCENLEEDLDVFSITLLRNQVTKEVALEGKMNKPASNDANVGWLAWMGLTNANKSETPKDGELENGHVSCGNVS